MTQEQHVDPIILELVQEGLIAIVSEMRAYLWRTGYSVNIHEAQDFSCALLDDRGRLVAKASEDHVLHIVPVSYCTRLVLEKFEGKINPGDIFLHNDPYTGGTHLNDIAFIRPVFAEGRLVFFVCVRAHWEDVGGMSPGSLSGSATEIYQEGVRLPPIKMFDRGVLNETALELILANVRVPRKSQGDFRAMVGTCELGERKLQALNAKYGTSSVCRSVEQLLVRSEMRKRQAIAAIPDGSYEYEFHLENGGGSPEPIRARVAIIVSGDELVVDFGGSSPMVRGPVNAGPAMAPMMVFASLKAMLDPEGMINAGSMTPVTVRLPEGSYLNASRPAACGGMAEATFSVASAMIGALACMLPDRAVGDLKGAGNNVCIGGMQPDTGGPFLFYEFAAGGTGGVREGDGNNGCRTFLEGDFGSIQPVEVVENECPLVIERSELCQDSGGPGESRGGLGIRRDIRVLVDTASLSYLIDKISIPPFGVLGGSAGGPNKFSVVRDGVELDPAPIPGKVTGYALRRDDLIVTKSAGGGGYGDPVMRHPDLVAQDVAAGYVSEGGARHDYGVVVRGGEVDGQATERARDQMCAEREKVNLVVARRTTEEARQHLCYASEATLARLGAVPGQVVEILNPRGAPLRLWTRVDDVPAGSLAVDEFSLRVVAARPGDARVVRRPRRPPGVLSP